MKRIEELDFARVIAMLGVIVIHVTAEYVYAPSGFMLFNMNLAFLMNQMVRFAVPLFVLLSGMSLGLSGRTETVSAFYKKRFAKIGIPYLIWSLVYILYSHREALGLLFSGELISLPDLFRFFLHGKAAPHLYFILILLQLYLLYPLLKRCVQATPLATLLLAFAMTYLVQMSYDIPQLRVLLIPRILEPHLARLFPTWIFYFVLGMVCTRARLQQLCEAVQKHALPICLITILFAFVYAAESAVTGNLDSVKEQLNVFTPLVLVACLSCWKWFASCTAIRKAVSFLADRSMTIYFSHMLVLFMLQPFPIFKRGMSGMLLFCAAVFVLSTLLATGIDLGIRCIRRQKKKTL